jgi:hypothetical protein
MRQGSESFLNFNPACQFIVCQIGDRARDYLATAGRNFRPFSSLHLLANSSPMAAQKVRAESIAEPVPTIMLGSSRTALTVP